MRNLWLARLPLKTVKGYPINKVPEALLTQTLKSLYSIPSVSSVANDGSTIKIVMSSPVIVTEIKPV